MEPTYTKAEIVTGFKRWLNAIKGKEQDLPDAHDPEECADILTGYMEEARGEEQPI